jgi:hypothetical protein
MAEKNKQNVTFEDNLQMRTQEKLESIDSPARELQKQKFSEANKMLQ